MDKRKTFRRSLLGLLLLFLVARSGFALFDLRAPAVSAQTSAAAPATGLNPIQKLGERLFREEGFTAPNGDFSTSCRTCHLFDEDPQGQRAYSDFFNRSWAPFRTQDPKRSVSRNAPGLYDVALMPRLHWDGEFASLEELVLGTFSGRPLGWLPGEEAQAFTRLRAVLLRENGAPPTYAQQFRHAFNVELAQLPEAELQKLVARAVADYLRTFRTRLAAPYDEFLRANQLTDLANNPKTAPQFLAELERRAATLRFVAGFDAAALRGLRVFFRTTGSSSVGNCVACHTPPLFTDFAFHNLGFSQLEYDQVHGAGQFAKLAIPNAATAQRPAARFRETPTRAKPGEADLGFWNFVDLKNAALRRAGETEDELLQRMIGAVKTPSLRHLAYNAPYMHTGAYTELDEALREIQRLSELARAGQIRSADAELAKIRLGEPDIAALVAFLKALNEELKVSY